ncbi:MAG: hypothetical protein V3U84_10270 [Thiotrichaceae bacterium]
MNYKTYAFTCLLLLMSSCSQQPLTHQVEPIPKILSSCYIVYDAGSSGTRLYIYEQKSADWVSHEGPKVAALADPVREIRDKSWTDVDEVITEVVSALNHIKQNGSINKKGKPKWKAFDWEKRCHLVSANVFATAGMRIAEQENRYRSSVLWKKLKQKLQARLGSSVKVNTRTLSGYEEGLYAWLAVRKNNKGQQFGIAEMGGASSQVTFPCEHCDTTNDAVKTITLAGKPMKIYSYSFLGLGQDEAPKTLGLPTSCAYGIGTIKKNWKEADCAHKISIHNEHGFRDPYNFKQHKKGIHNQLPKYISGIKNWYLTGAFNHMDNSQIKTCCLNKGKCYNEKKSCFRSVYLKNYLKALSISPSSEKMDVSWTSGAVVCAVNDCLQKTAPPPVCRWTDKGCL